MEKKSISLIPGWWLTLRGFALLLLLVQTASLACWGVCLLSGEVETWHKTGLLLGAISVSELFLTQCAKRVAAYQSGLSSAIALRQKKALRELFWLEIAVLLCGNVGFFGRVPWPEPVWRGCILASGLAILPALAVEGVLLRSLPGPLLSPIDPLAAEDTELAELIEPDEPGKAGHAEGKQPPRVARLTLRGIWTLVCVSSLISLVRIAPVCFGESADGLRGLCGRSAAALRLASALSRQWRSLPA